MYYFTKPNLYLSLKLTRNFSIELTILWKSSNTTEFRSASTYSSALDAVDEDCRLGRPCRRVDLVFTFAVFRHANRQSQLSNLFQ